MGKNSYFGAVVLAVIVAFLSVVGPVALIDGATANNVANEAITVDYSQETSVDEDGVDYDESVNVTADGQELEAGTDYEWSSTNGNVTWFDTAATSDGQEAFIDYTVYQVTGTSSQIGQLTAGLLFVGAFVVVWIMGSKAIGGVL